MCMIGRKILIQGEAKKNKSRRKKYFVLNCGPNYTSPRLDYFSNIDSWNQYKEDLCDNICSHRSPRSIDLSNLFFVDNTHRLKPKHGGLDLYMEDKHVMLVFLSDAARNQWKDIFDNVVYKNGRIKLYPKIEHVLQVSLRVKPKESIDKAVLLRYRADCRACFMRTSLIFVNKRMDNPHFSIEYQFIRNLESRFDGTFRLEIGRAALIGECYLILQLSDYEESNAAHTMLINCTKLFKVPKPEPPRLRSSGNKKSDRPNALSTLRGPSLGRRGSLCTTIRSDSCIGFSRDSFSLIGSQTKTAEQSLESSDEHYMTMKVSTDADAGNHKKTHNFVEHISRIYKCVMCGYFTRIIIFCPICTSTSSVNSSLRSIYKTDASSKCVISKLLPMLHSKTQSLTERPNTQSVIVRKTKSKNLVSDLQKPIIFETSPSSSKTSTNEMSSSLSVSSNRHDDDIFVELDFNNLEHPSLPNHKVECSHCMMNLTRTSLMDLSPIEQQCLQCSHNMVFVTMVIDESDLGYNDWIAHITSLFANQRTDSSNGEYIEVNSTGVDIESRCTDQ